MRLGRVGVCLLYGGEPQHGATGQGLTALLPVGGMVLVCTAGAHAAARAVLGEGPGR